MVTKIKINDNSNAPLNYLADVPNFANGSEFAFKPGVNIIVGRNGSGKSTLLKLIKKYMLVDFQESDAKQTSELFDMSGKLLDGVSVYGDYKIKTYSMVHQDELNSGKGNDYILSSTETFGTAYWHMHSSTGEGMLISLSSLFKEVFVDKKDSSFPKIDNKEYESYMLEHTDKGISNNEVTILLDEPDRNLDIDNIDEIKGILSYHKENVQIIATIHNPLLISILSANSDVNIIEMTEGYVSQINSIIQTIQSNGDNRKQ